MSDQIKHECGIALVRLRKPLSYYKDKYGTAFYGLNKMYLLMEKQHNRGQDGVGLANIKFDMKPGERFISRKRSVSTKPIQEIFDHVHSRISQITNDDRHKLGDVDFLKENAPFTGEVFLGHLRYGTYGKNSIEACHPFLRQNNWMTRNLIMAGNFNLTNVDELFELLVKLGQHPKEKADTVTVMEKVGHFLDMSNEFLFNRYKDQGYSNAEITQKIIEKLKVEKILRKASEDWDGGYAMAGVMGHGDAFVLRDPNGIRPAHYYIDDEVVVVASERAAIQTAFNVPYESIEELTPGHALIMKRTGFVGEKLIREPKEKKACSFERIYFSRGSDRDIYRERKELGRSLCDTILPKVRTDLQDTVFSYIPNTAESAFYGMVKGMEAYLDDEKKRLITAELPNISEERLSEIMALKPRAEKVAIKDAKLRTFITQDSERDDLVRHVYDITYGSIVRGKDTLVVIDDSIVRGTTLRQSILRMLDRLGPKKIIIVSSAPQIRYPDCYGIDMAKMGEFVAFQAALDLLKEQGKGKLIQEVYAKCKAQENSPIHEIRNHVKEIYEPFTADEVSQRIAELLRPHDIEAEVSVIYQTIEGLHKACPDHTGDWYFTGDYPTPGGNRVVNKAFMNFVEGKNKRAY